MDYISAAEAGRRIGVTDKTIRTWITEGGPYGKLSAHHPGGVKNRLAIPVSEVERIARERGQYQGGEIPGIADLARQVDELRATIATLQEEIELMKEQVEQRAAPALSADLWSREEHHIPASIRYPITPRRQSAASEPLPPGAILARRFAEAHGVNPSTFRDHYTGGKNGEICPVSARPKQGRPRETEYYVMPEQQALIFDFWRRHDVPFDITGDD